VPIHDWSRVPDGIFHAFHVAWMAEMQIALNNGVLPADYYALAEQIAGSLGPDVLTLQANGSNGGTPASPGKIQVAATPPQVRFTAASLMDEYVLKQRTLIIRHVSEDRIVALIEIVSPGNKASQDALRSFLDKATEALYRGYHLLILDLQPPGRRDPQGIHGALWAEISDDAYQPPADKALTLASYSAGQPKRAYVEPVAVGDTLPAMPLVLEPEASVNVPLEVTYLAAYRGVPQRWRAVLEGTAI
jgi:hypothetical protein